MMVSAVIPTYEGRTELLRRLIESIPSGVEKITVRGDMSLSEKRNYGAKKSKGEFILFADDDNELAYQSIKMLRLALQNKKVAVAGMVGCYDHDKRKVCDSGAYRMKNGFTKDKYFNKQIFDLWNETKMPYEVDEVANVFMIRRDVFEKLGGFDTERFPIDLDEADFCIRAKRAGYRVVVVPSALTYHRSAAQSRLPNFRRPKNAYYMGRNRILFHKKHGLGLGFVPIFILSYVVSLMIKCKYSMIKHFLKGVCDGLQNRTGNRKEYRV